MSLFTPSQQQEILLLLQQNRKVEAVKWVMEHSNLGLKESKDFIDQVIETQSFDDLRMADDEVFYANNNHIYKAIQFNLDTDEIYILYHDGRKELIDEDYPEWNDIMNEFGQGQHYETADEFLDAMDEKNHAIYQNPQRNAQQRPSASFTQPIGIEDQTKKNGLSRVVMIIIAIIIAVIIYQIIGH